MTEKSRTGKPAENPAPAAPGVDQVRPLDQIASDAKALDDGAAPAPGAAPIEANPQQINIAAKELGEALIGLRDTAALLTVQMGVFEEGQLQAIWPDKHLEERVAEPLAVIIARQGGEVGPMLEKYGPWIALGFGLIAPGAMTYKIAKANLAARTVDADSGGQGGQQQPA